MGEGCCSPVQFLSSLLSEQSRYPSQRSVSMMHASPSSHLNPLGHDRLLGVAERGRTVQDSRQGSSLGSTGMFAGGCTSGMELRLMCHTLGCLLLPAPGAHAMENNNWTSNGNQHVWAFYIFKFFSAKDFCFL